jgi:hypothetical protein
LKRSVSKGLVGDGMLGEWIARDVSRILGERGYSDPNANPNPELRPGEALCLPASYLHGTAVEIMANSDNVLRGGLTAKHVDAPELLATLDFEPHPPEVIAPRGSDPLESSYATPAREFELAALAVRADRPFASGPRDGIEILFCSLGEVAIDGAVEPAAASIKRGRGRGRSGGRRRVSTDGAGGRLPCDGAVRLSPQVGRPFRRVGRSRCDRARHHDCVLTIVAA